MADFYGDLIPVVDQLLQEYGNNAVLRHKSDGVYNAAASAVVTSAPVDDTVFAAVFDFDEKFVNGTSIRTGDKQIFMSVVGASSEPKAGDQVLWGTDILILIQAKVIAPARTAVLYELQGRKP